MRYSQFLASIRTTTAATLTQPIQYSMIPPCCICTLPGGSVRTGDGLVQRRYTMMGVMAKHLRIFQIRQRHSCLIGQCGLGMAKMLLFSNLKHSGYKDCALSYETFLHPWNSKYGRAIAKTVILLPGSIRIIHDCTSRQTNKVRNEKLLWNN